MAKFEFDFFGIMATGYKVYSLKDIKELYNRSWNKDGKELYDWVESNFVKTIDDWYVDRQEQGVIQKVLDDYNQDDQETWNLLINDPTFEPQEVL